MKQFVIEKDFWDLFPEARIGVVVCQGLDNRLVDPPGFETRLRAAEEAALEHLQAPVFSQNPVVAVWREAFKQFKTKKGARSSIEALLKRAHKKNPIGTINPLVDLYNALSLTYAIPCGGEDIDKFEGDLRLTCAVGDEPFVTLGSDKSEPPYAGEVIYKDDVGAVCRCWNWRESVRTMLTEKTRNAFLCMELVDGKREADLRKALAELKEAVSQQLGATCQVEVLTKECPRISLIVE